MRPTTDAHLDLVVEAIRDYLSRHPGAADSELGIAQWWLRAWLQQSGEWVSSERLHQALQQLEQQGVLEVINVSGVGHLWRAVGGRGLDLTNNQAGQ